MNKTRVSRSTYFKRVSLFEYIWLSLYIRDIYWTLRNGGNLAGPVSSYSKHVRPYNFVEPFRQNAVEI